MRPLTAVAIASACGYAAKLVAVLVIGGCSSVNLASTVAGGACGSVDYRITFLGTPLFGVQAERECVSPSQEPSEQANN
jgi:hypothetical protein